MGLKNYHEQLAVLRSMEGPIEELENYVQFLNSVIITIQSVWERNVDQQSVLTEISHIIGSTDHLISDYSYYEANAVQCLNAMNTLEKIIHHPKVKQHRGYNSLYSPERNMAKKDYIRIDVGLVEDQRMKMSAYTGKLQQAYSKTKKINGKIDPLIIEQLAKKGGISGQFVSIEKSMYGLLRRNEQLAVSLQSICDNYLQKEKELKELVSNLSQKGESNGQVNPQLERRFVQYKEQVKGGNWPIVADFSNPDLYPKQSSKKCTLYANLYLMRRYAMMMRDENWIQIDEKNCNNFTNKALWQGGMVDDYEFTVAGKTVHVQQCCRSDKYMTDKAIPDMDAAEKREYLRRVLAKHPEGVVAYDWDTATAGSGMHAILVTGYDEATGRFTVADPATGGGLIDEGEAIVLLEKIESIWVIDSY